MRETEGWVVFVTASAGRSVDCRREPCPAVRRVWGESAQAHRARCCTKDMQVQQLGADQAEQQQALGRWIIEHKRQLDVRSADAEAAQRSAVQASTGARRGRALRISGSRGSPGSKLQIQDPRPKLEPPVLTSEATGGANHHHMHSAWQHHDWLMHNLRRWN